MPNAETYSKFIQQQGHLYSQKIRPAVGPPNIALHQKHFGGQAHAGYTPDAVNSV